MMAKIKRPAITSMDKDVEKSKPTLEWKMICCFGKSFGSFLVSNIKLSYICTIYVPLVHSYIHTQGIENMYPHNLYIRVHSSSIHDNPKGGPTQMSLS